MNTNTTEPKFEEIDIEDSDLEMEIEMKVSTDIELTVDTEKGQLPATTKRPKLMRPKLMALPSLKLPDLNPPKVQMTEEDMNRAIELIKKVQEEIDNEKTNKKDDE